MASIIGRATIVLDNAEAVDALADACVLLRDLASDMPWRDEPTEAVNEIIFACDRLKVVRGAKKR